jgi:hypothetical protein
MSTKTTPAQRKARTNAQPMLPALAAKAGVFSHLRLEPLEHGVRVLPRVVRVKAKATPKGRAVAATLTAPVEVRIERGAGSPIWRELVGLITTAAVDRLAGVSEAGQRRLLTDLRETLAEEATSTTSAEILAALRRVAGTIPVGSDDVPPANTAALERALARGAATLADLAQRPDMLTGETLGERVGLTRATIDNRRKANQLLALELGSKRGVRYPAWQVELLADAATRKAFESALAELGSTGPWSRYRFFVTPRPSLGGRTAIDALKARQGDAVRQAAEAWAAGEQAGH